MQKPKIDYIYLDFAEAFDPVNRGFLLDQLDEWGILGMVMNWIKGFISESKQMVTVEISFSGMYDAQSGVPLG